MRTWKPFYTSLPSRPLLVAMVVVLLVTLSLPYSPLKGILGLKPLPISTLMLLGLITILYAGASELTKKFFQTRAFGKETIGLEATAPLKLAMQIRSDGPATVNQFK